MILGGKLVRAAAASTIVGFAVVAPATARDDGVKIGQPSYLRNLVSAEKLEVAAASQYVALTDAATKKGVLADESDPQLERLRRISADLLPFTEKFNSRAKDWAWRVNLIKAPQVNAFCMPGGKIVFYSGIIERLKLTDDEIAMIMGHEVAHALREHARERAAKSTLTNLGALALSVLVGGGAGDLAQVGGGLMNLKFSRDDESEADLIGMELAARAGYDPRASVTLWNKMADVAKSGPPAWLSTHPAGPARIKNIEANLPDVVPLYEAAKKDKKS